MKNLLKYIPVIFLACYISTQAFAQINEGYILSDAEISQVTENINVQNISKKALIILPENENQLYVRMSISNDSSEAN
ncbi:MAG: hypothetical protein ABIO77_02485 [Ginsengibacter sp.]